MADTEVEHPQQQTGGLAGSVYDAFISYSHAADDLLAPRLQAGLQRFAKPWWKRRALRIFRDETSLSANPHLWSSITEALDGSAWFVLLLSPEAASSEWVNQEIDYWIQHNESERIIPVLTEGHLAWDAGQLTGDAVPPSLQDTFANEPRWVDLRFARSEEQLDVKNPAFAAVVADLASPLRGVAKDELASEEVRQHKRTVRTVWGAGAALLVLAVAAVGFGIQSASNADEAERQAAIAAENEADARDQAERADANAAAEEEARLAAEDAKRQAFENEQLAKARELASSAIAVVDADPALATWLALLAIEQTPEEESHPVEVVNALWKSASANALADSIDVGPAGNTFIDLSSDGQFLAVSSSENTTLELRSTAGLNVEWRYSEETEDGFSKPEFSPDGQRIALPVVGSGAAVPWRDGPEDDLPNRVVILEAQTGSVLTVLEFPSCESIDRATWSLEGDLLAVGTGPSGCTLPGLLGSTWVEVFDTSSWDSVALIDWEGNDFAGVRPLFVGPERLAAFPSHSSPRVYETESFSLVGLLDQVGPTLPQAVSLEAGLVASFSNDLLIARLHDLTSGAQIDVLGELEAWPEFPFGLAFSTDGRRVAAATAGRILIWDIESGEQIFRLTGGAGAMNVVFGQDGDVVYSAHLDGSLKVWDLSTGGAVVDEVEKLTSATFINGNSFTVSSEIGAMERIEFKPYGRFVQFFSTENGDFILPPLPYVGGPAYALPNDRFLIGSGEDEWQWQVYDPATETAVDVGRPCAPETCYASISAAGSEFAIIYKQDDGLQAETFNSDTFQNTGAFVVEGQRLNGFGKDWLLQSLGEQGGAFFFTDRSTGAELLRISIPPTHMEVSNRGSTVALSGRQGPIQLVNTTTWETTILDLPIGIRRGLSFSPDDSLLAVADEDEILIIDIEQQEIIQEAPVALVSDVFWFNQSEILIGDRNGLWARLSLEFDDLRQRAVESLELRPITDQECATYGIDPCPTLADLKNG